MWKLVWNVRFQGLWLRIWFWIFFLIFESFGKFSFCSDLGNSHSSAMLETVCAAANWRHSRRIKLLKNYFPLMKTLLGSDVHCCQCKHSPSVHARIFFFFFSPKKPRCWNTYKEHGVRWKHEGHISKLQLHKKLEEPRKTFYQEVIYGHFYLYCSSVLRTSLNQYPIWQ